MRSLVIILLLVVVFLAGILVGSDREPSKYTNIQQPQLTQQATPWEIEEEEQFFVEENTLIIGESEYTTQKVAALLEAGVKGFYEVIVELMFQISSFFI